MAGPQKEKTTIIESGKMTIEKIKAAILKATGNPVSGAIRENADIMAEAAYYAMNSNPAKTKKADADDEIKETRVVNADETR